MMIASIPIVKSILMGPWNGCPPSKGPHEFDTSLGMGSQNHLTPVRREAVHDHYD